MRLSGFCSAERGGFRAWKERGGVQAASGVGSMDLERMWRSLRLGKERHPWEL